MAVVAAVDAPLQVLEHPAAVLCVDLNQHALVSGSGNQLFVWTGDAERGRLNGHSNKVLATALTRERTAVSGSADKTVALWDLETLKRLRKHEGHKGIVNDVCLVRAGGQYLSGSDDGSLRVWDPRQKAQVGGFTGKWAVLAVACSPGFYFSAGTSAVVDAWDPRNPTVPVFSLQGCTDTITGIDCNRETLVASSMDQTVRRWDVRPFVAAARASTVALEAEHGPEMALQRTRINDDQAIVAASASAVQYRYMGAESAFTGHLGTVVDVRLNSGVLVSSGLDRTVRVVRTGI